MNISIMLEIENRIQQLLPGNVTRIIFCKNPGVFPFRVEIERVYDVKGVFPFRMAC